ncbi:MAG: deoxyguanosinetriphosphate triphosphohydrolase [Alphaproteobacteria bacterium]|jgi:dGTPase|nr:deoxyguanosinetriphosphate triphosphohydrolase [Rickettsiales bacterium]
MKNAEPHGLVPYAAHPDQSRGRLVAEADCPMRNPHQRDRDRIIHSVAFRRLEYKTQVFVNHEGDHYRTRLTHSLEVSQLARSLARNLHLNEDLAEALALAHDLGHTPFGHAGEEGLNAAMGNYGGFDHNAQTIRILTLLEQRYAEFDGLNLTWEVLEGIAKHNGPLVGSPPRALAYYARQQDLELHSYPSTEAQIAAIADDIAYNNHDLDDGLRAGFFRLTDLEALPLIGELLAKIRLQHPSLSEPRQAHEVIRRLISSMVADVIATTQANVKRHGIKTVADVRQLGAPLVAFSPEMEQVNRAIKTYLFKHMYRHYRVNRMSSKAKRVMGDLFRFFLAEPNCLPTIWYSQTDGAGTQQTAEIVADFIAGMTDRFALDEHARIFDVRERP